ncbi:hypothetical protein GRS48_04420 [Halorubrum sp. JWXQ-INN 858]|uniref:hypothetical protein n=1 Tax=Halorubrum sp. JWXQ-INN 858 TaxID=2690782 RepID=UPI001356B8FD|nr:hypothetical protein [Halorubrum sp. JWXQ-INN 858]MWV64071.1 hypothetical protein [Halorubrum sp. JWXQ-INN 858]
MSESLYGRYGRQVLGGALLALALLSAFAGFLQIQQHGLTAVGDVAVSLYIAGLVVWGYFREGFDTFRFRVLLYVGLVAWGTVDHLGGSDSPFTFVLLIGGSLLLARAAYKYAERQRKPVYDR